MTRTEFIKAYAERSDLKAETAILGFLEVEGHYMLAMPCACGNENCEGWAMTSPSGIDHQLRFYAPEPLRVAYIEAITK